MARDYDFISVSPQCWIGTAVMILLVPFPWLCGCFFAALVHELFHCLALFLCGERIYHIQIGWNGARIDTGNLTDGKMILCALAGPFGGLLLLLVVRQFPRLAVCGLFQTLFNLLPIYPLDGGRALHAFASLCSQGIMKIKISCK